jgi:ribonuclease inhibitor
MKVVINGNDIKSESDFHKHIALVLNFPSYYGKNLDALWDVLSTDIERPITLVWENSSVSQETMREEFPRSYDLLDRVVAQDIEWGLDEKFEVSFE